MLLFFEHVSNQENTILKGTKTSLIYNVKKGNCKDSNVNNNYRTLIIKLLVNIYLCDSVLQFITVNALVSLDSL